MYESLGSVLTECGKIRPPASIDSKTLKVLVQSILRMQKSFDNKNIDLNQGLKLMIDDLQSNLSEDVSKLVRPVLESMQGEFEGLKQWLEDFEMRLVLLIEGKNEQQVRELKTIIEQKDQTINDLTFKVV